MSFTMSFSIVPDSVFIDDKSSLKFIVQNTSESEPVTFKVGRGGSYINVQFPEGNEAGDLVSDLNFNGTTNNAHFSCNPVSGQFKITADKEIDIAPGNSLQVTFNDMPINAQTGVAKVNIEYKIDTDSSSKTIDITKQAKELGVIAWLDPLVVGLNQSSPLQFRSAASTKVVISGYPDGAGEQSFRTPPDSQSHNVNVGGNANGQRTYSVTAWAGGKQSPSVSVTLSEVPPYIYQYTPTTPQKIDPGSEATLDWRAHFESGNTMQWLQTSKADVNPPFNVAPGTELVKVYNVANANAMAMPDQVAFNLSIDGFREAAKQDFTFTVKPAQLNYLKYKDEAMTEIIYDYSPESWKPAVHIRFGNNSATMTIYQPGYKQDTYYLSTTDKEHPMIRYFDAKNGQLTWHTANLTSLSLQVTIPDEHKSIDITGVDIKSGSLEVPAGAGTVVLTGVNEKGQSVRSQLKLN